MVEFLLQHGANPQYQLRDGSTMLIEAARSGNPAVLKLLLDFPKCLTKPTMLSNSVHQLVHFSQSPDQQRSIYQPIVNTSPSIGSSAMPPPPPPLPMSVSDICFDPAHVHIPHSCHSHQLSYQNPSTVSVSVNITEPQNHVNATALANAYAFGWAAGAAARVQQHHQTPTVNTSMINSSNFFLI